MHPEEAGDGQGKQKKHLYEGAECHSVDEYANSKNHTGTSGCNKQAKVNGFYRVTEPVPSRRTHAAAQGQRSLHSCVGFCGEDGP